jgi:hypothetical protein
VIERGMGSNLRTTKRFGLKTVGKEGLNFAKLPDCMLHALTIVLIYANDVKSAWCFSGPIEERKIEC